MRWYQLSPWHKEWTKLGFIFSLLNVCRLKSSVWSSYKRDGMLENTNTSATSQYRFFPFSCCLILWLACFAMRTHHVAQPHSLVFGVVLHQRVVVCGEESAAADLLSKLLYNSAGNRCAIVCGCAPSCEMFTHHTSKTFAPTSGSTGHWSQSDHEYVSTRSNKLT